MDNMIGITGIRIKIIEVYKTLTGELNNFLERHDGHIIDIQKYEMPNNVCKFIILYESQ